MRLPLTGSLESVRTMAAHVLVTLTTTGLDPLESVGARRIARLNTDLEARGWQRMQGRYWVWSFEVEDESLSCALVRLAETLDAAALAADLSADPHVQLVAHVMMGTEVRKIVVA